MNVEGEKLEFIRALQDDRKYIDDTIPMVSSDGEPHEILTLVAVGTGLVAAVIVLIFLIVLIDCRKRNGSSNKNEPQTQEVFSIFGGKEMFDIRKIDCENDNTRVSGATIEVMSSSTTTILNERRDIGETIFSKALPGISTVSCSLNYLILSLKD